MKHVLLVLLLSAGALYLAACAWLFLQQRSLIYFPVPRNPAYPAATVAVPGAELCITTRTLPGPRALLYFGGNAEDVSYSLPGFAQAFPDRSLYLVHYRGYGGSSGQPSEADFHADAAFLFDKVHADRPNVVLVGRSLGTGVAIRLAAERPAERLILVTPYDSLQEIAARQFPLFPVRWLLRDKFESWRYAPAITAPTLLLLAEQDRVVPRDSSERLLARFAKGVARSKILAGTDHVSISASPEYLPTLGGRE